jgi:hypothetical protein
MSIRSLLGAFAVACLLAACGGDNASSTQPSTRLLATTSTGAELRAFSGLRSDYVITATSNGYLVVNLSAGGAATNVGANARLRFADSSIVLGSDGVAGQAYRLYQAAFNRTPDPAGLGFWIDAMERGTPAEQVADGFVTSKEYLDTYGSAPTSDQVVTKYYQNILHRSGEYAGYAFWKDVLERKAATPAAVLLGFSDSAENKTGVQAAIKNGIVLIEPGVPYVPAANAGTDRKADPYTPVALDGSTSTVAMGKTITYSWTISAKPTGSTAQLTNAASARPLYTPDIPGVYEITLVVSDGAASSQPTKVRIDSSLWAPAEGAMPATGNAIYLESDAGDYVGGGYSGAGRNYLYTPSNGVMTVRANGGVLRVGFNGDKQWDGDFATMSNLTRLQRGWYPGLSRYPFHNPAKGGLSWGGDGRGCNTLTGWFLVDSVTYDGDTLTAIDLRFEQHCEGAAPALHGRVRWSANDISAPPPGPAQPPVGLWQPANGATPASGNYVYLESTQGDYIGGGGVYSYTDQNSQLRVTGTNGRVGINISGDKTWTGDFAPMNSLPQLVVGYYGDATRYPFNNPVKAGQSWYGDGRGCNTLTGWFVVDRITWVQGTMTELDLRFEQHCEGGASSLRGKIHWSASEAGAPPGPVVAPAGLWQPLPNTLPSAGNYIYLESTAGDYIGGGGSYLYTDMNAQLRFTAIGAKASVNVSGDKFWSGDFAGMSTLTRLAPGYYGGLQRYPFNNPVKGGLSWSGDGRGCNTLTGWFVVDKVTYVQEAMTELDLRFEQHCEGGVSALHGKLHWAATNSTTPPGPITF